MISIIAFLFVYIRRELEQRLRELKRRKREKKMTKLKEFEEAREKDKKRWTDFNSKVFIVTKHFDYWNDQREKQQK